MRERIAVVGAVNPYEAPGASPARPTGVYCPAGWKTTAAASGIVASVVFGIAVGILTMQVQDAPRSAKLAYVAVLGVVSLVATFVALATTAIFLIWMYRAATNVRAFGQYGLEYSPGWGIGSWFVPFVSLVVPYRALKEIWRASDPETVGTNDLKWVERPVPSIFPLWWAAYVGASLVSYAGAFITYIAASGHDPGTASTGVLVTLASNMLLAVAAAAIVSIMKQLDRRQELAARKLSL